jgi:homoserine/homoserine lactone efflux protein
MNADTFLLYLAAWSLVAVTPGPAVMCAMAQASRYGMKHAFAGVAGIQLGHFVFFGCVAGGLAALLAAATGAFTILRIVGAVYLLYLGVKIIASTFRSHVASQSVSAPPPRRSLVLQGLLIQVTNPKALIFMSALLPQFIDPQRPLALQLGVLLAATIAVDTIVLSTYAWVAVRGATSLRSSGFVTGLERVFGAALVLFGIRLLASRK